MLSPIVGSFFDEYFRPKPTISILRDETCLVPMWGENWVLIKTVVKNLGSAPEENVQVRFEVDSPWIFQGNSTWAVHEIENLPAGQAIMVTINVHNPSVSQLQHGTFHVRIRVSGKTQTWDSAEFSESW